MDLGRCGQIYDNLDAAFVVLSLQISKDMLLVHASSVLKIPCRIR